MRHLRGRVSFANVTALLALFVALGSGAYAITALPPNSVGTKQLRKNAVVSSKVKNHSLLAKDFKAGQLPRGATGRTGPPGQDFKYAHMVVVKATSAAPTDNGTALLNALAAITDSSVARPYLLKLEPGVYDLGTRELTMKSYVDVEGSGAGVTTIKGGGISDFIPGAQVQLASNAELRSLAVDISTGSGSNFADALEAPHATFPVLRDISVDAEGIGATAILNYGTIDIEDSSLTASAASGQDTVGVSQSGTLMLVNSTVNVGASGANRATGIEDGGPSTIVGDRISAVNPSSVVGATGYALYEGTDSFGTGASKVYDSILDGSSGYPADEAGVKTVGGSAHVANSEIDGGSSTTGVKCVGDFDQDFNALSSICQ